MKRNFIDVEVDPAPSFNKVQGQQNVEKFLMRNYDEFADLEQHVARILTVIPRDEDHILDKYNLIGAIKLKYDDIFKDSTIMHKNTNFIFLQFMVESGMLILLSREKLEEIHLNIPVHAEQISDLLQAQEKYNSEIVFDEPCPRSGNTTPFPSPCKIGIEKDQVKMKFSYGRLNFRDYFNAALSVLRLFLITSANVIRNINEPMPVDDLSIPPVKERTARNTSVIQYDDDLSDETPLKKRKKGSKKSPKNKRRLSVQERKNEVLVRQVSALDLYQCYKCSDNVLDFFIFFMSTMEELRGKINMTVPDVFENVYYWVVNMLHETTVRDVLLQSDPHLCHEVSAKHTSSFLQSKNFVCLKQYCLSESLYIDDNREGAVARFAVFMKKILDSFHLENEIGRSMDIMAPKKMLEFGDYKCRNPIILRSMYRFLELNDQVAPLASETGKFSPVIQSFQSCDMDVEEPFLGFQVMQPPRL